MNDRNPPDFIWVTQRVTFLPNVTPEAHQFLTLRPGKLLLYSPYFDDSNPLFTTKIAEINQSHVDETKHPRVKDATESRFLQ